MENYVIHNPKIWEHLEDISCYNHNYYRNPETGEVLLEECDDDVYCTYYVVEGNDQMYVGTCYWDEVQWGESEEDVKLYNY